MRLPPRSDDALGHWLQRSSASSLPTDRKLRSAGAIEKNRFLKAGPGTVWVRRTLAGVLDVVDEMNVIEAFEGWRRRDGFLGAYFDHRADLEAATGQGVKAPVKRGVPGATFLAIMALPVFPVRTPDPFTSETVGWTATRSVRKGFGWPVWPDPLGLAGVKALVDHPVVRDVIVDRSEPLQGGSRRALDGLGLSAVFRSERTAAGNNDGALAPALACWERDG